MLISIFKIDDGFDLIYFSVLWRQLMNYIWLWHLGILSLLSTEGKCQRHHMLEQGILLGRYGLFRKQASVLYILCIAQLGVLVL